MARPDPQCPVRPGDPCSLCYPGATGPQDCGLVWQVRHDPDLQERLAEVRRLHADKMRARRAAHLAS